MPDMVTDSDAAMLPPFGAKTICPSFQTDAAIGTAPLAEAVISTFDGGVYAAGRVAMV